MGGCEGVCGADWELGDFGWGEERGWAEDGDGLVPFVSLILGCIFTVVGAIRVGMGLAGDGQVRGV